MFKIITLSLQSWQSSYQDGGFISVRDNFYFVLSKSDTEKEKEKIEKHLSLAIKDIFKGNIENKISVSNLNADKLDKNILIEYFKY